MADVTVTTFRPFHKVLIANRGEIASRIQRTAHSLGLATVAVFSDPDAGSPFVATATQAVRLPGSHARDTYLDAEAVLAAAERAGADAIHPGYGFLSEDTEFASAVMARGLVWIGPPIAAMQVMAGKVEAKARMSSVGVPTLPSAVVSPGADLSAAARSVGFPLLVKASAGGGGKGMRLVSVESDLDEAVAAASREAASSFGDGTVFLERFLATPRHIEVQVIGDSHGTVLHLGDRECSIQRRHQKVIEEAPAPTITPDLRSQMTLAAVAGAHELGYVGAGTFEFLVDGDEFFFLEMNTRLQVEHPVTEEVTGRDLVELQLLVAAGHPLPFAQYEVTTTGHAIEARLYAEDPYSDWMPSTGTIHRFEPAAGPGVRWDSGVRTGSTVTPFYDPMLAKVIGYAPARDVAAARLATALDRTLVHGVTTNASLLADILRHPHFLAAQTSTAFLDEHPQLTQLSDRSTVTAEHLAAAIAVAVARRDLRGPAAIAPPGWRNVPTGPQRRRFVVIDAPVDVSYVAIAGSVEVSCLGHELRCEVVSALDDVLDVEIDGIRRRYTIDVAGSSWHIHGADGSTTVTAEPRFAIAGAETLAGGLVAPVPGTVVKVHVSVGDVIAAGQVVVVIEAMKVEHQIRCAAAGVVEAVLVIEGQSVDAHAPLIKVSE